MNKKYLQSLHKILDLPNGLFDIEIAKPGQFVFEWYKLGPTLVFERLIVIHSPEAANIPVIESNNLYWVYQVGRWIFLYVKTQSKATGY